MCVCVSLTVITTTLAIMTIVILMNGVGVDGSDVDGGDFGNGDAGSWSYIDALDLLVSFGDSGVELFGSTVIDHGLQ